MIQRILTLVTFLSLQLFAAQYDNTLLDIEAKLFPKIAMLEKNIQEKDTSIFHIVIISQELDIETAEKLRKRVLKNYPDKLLNKELLVEIKQTRNALQRGVDTFIVLQHSPKELTQIASWANTHNIVSLSYDAADLEYGILGSIYLGKNTKPYLNLEVIKKYGFVFDSYLLQLSKFKE